MLSILRCMYFNLYCQIPLSSLCLCLKCYINYCLWDAPGKMQKSKHTVHDEIRYLLMMKIKNEKKPQQKQPSNGKKELLWQENKMTPKVLRMAKIITKYEHLSNSNMSTLQNQRQKKAFTWVTQFFIIFLVFIFSFSFLFQVVSTSSPNNTIYYPTALRRVQITPKTNTNITRYLYPREPARNLPART